MVFFNEMMASALEREQDYIAPQEVEKLFNKKGKLKRYNIPQWVKRAIYHRDRGRCVLCNKDLTGIINIENKENYDHIIPLAMYGLNDISNIQLLCKECNQIDKKDKRIQTSDEYESWY